MPSIFLFFLLLPSAAGAVDFTSSDLPVVVIDTDGRSIPDEPKIDAWMGVIDNGPGRRNSLGDPYDGSEGPIAIEIRGSTSLKFPKKSFAFETRQADGENRNVSLLGMPPENDWILYGPYSDKSLLRNVLVYWMARRMGAYASRSRFCEVVINDDYLGVYVLLEKIKRDGDRVDIARLNPDELDGEDVTGGYIIRLDRYIEGVDRGWYSAYSFRGNRVFYQYYYPQADNIKPEQEAYIRSYIDSLEAALARSGGDYGRFLDLASFADYLIVNEVAKNVDGYRLSSFMHKDRDGKGGKLTMGPVWDFNIALGNINYNDHPRQEVQPPSTHLLQIDNGNTWSSALFWYWWRRLLKDEEFIHLLEERWHTHRTGALLWSELEAKIDSLAVILQEAQARNFERWPILGRYVWPNRFIGQTHDQEVAYVKRWLGQRLAWLDDHFIEQARQVPDIGPEDLALVRGTDTEVTIPTPHPQILTKLSGDGQEGPAGSALSEPFVVEVRDQDNHPFKGVLVAFFVTAGGGTLSVATDTTDANGHAASILTLGRQIGTNTVSASVAGLDSVAFTATAQATSDFDGNGEVGFPDFFLWVNAFGGTDPRFDLDGNGIVDFGDFFIFADHFGGPVRSKLLSLAREMIGLPDGLQLMQNAPNPFNGSAAIRFTLPRDGAAELSVYNLAGQKIATLAEGFHSRGTHTVHWYGRDEKGGEVSSGVYLYRLRTGTESMARKLVVVR